MDRKQFTSLKRGDIVRHVRTGNSFVIDSSDGQTYIGLDSINISNPDEWVLFTHENQGDSKTVLQQPQASIAAELLKRWLSLEFSPMPWSDQDYGCLLRETDEFIAQQRAVTRYTKVFQL